MPDIWAFKSLVPSAQGVVYLLCSKFVTSHQKVIMHCKKCQIFLIFIRNCGMEKVQSFIWVKIRTHERVFIHVMYMGKSFLKFDFFVTGGPKNLSIFYLCDLPGLSQCDLSKCTIPCSWAHCHFSHCTIYHNRHFWNLQLCRHWHFSLPHPLYCPSFPKIPIHFCSFPSSTTLIPDILPFLYPFNSSS